MGAGVGYWVQETLDSRCFEPDAGMPKSGNSFDMKKIILPECFRSIRQMDSLLSEPLVKVHGLCRGYFNFLSVRMIRVYQIIVFRRNNGARHL